MWLALSATAMVCNKFVEFVSATSLIMFVFETVRYIGRLVGAVVPFHGAYSLDDSAKLIMVGAHAERRPGYFGTRRHFFRAFLNTLDHTCEPRGKIKPPKTQMTPSSSTHDVYSTQSPLRALKKLLVVPLFPWSGFRFRQRSKGFRTVRSWSERLKKII